MQDRLKDSSEVVGNAAAGEGEKNKHEDLDTFGMTVRYFSFL